MRGPFGGPFFMPCGLGWQTVSRAEGMAPCSRENVKEMATGRMSVGQGGGGRRQGQGRCLSISLTLSGLEEYRSLMRGLEVALSLLC